MKKTNIEYRILNIQSFGVAQDKFEGENLRSSAVLLVFRRSSLVCRR